MRDEHGNLHLSKAAKAFHPGQGVYRSSYMNARRLAATETNMAYRTADHLRWQQFDFVVGIEIHLSNNHNCKGVPAGMFYDICDELKGKYPKDFVFTGWHPHCRCYATTILKTPEEMEADTERVLDGEPTDTNSVNEVDEVPPQFNEWLERNEQRIARAKQLPYFLRDNGTITGGRFTLNDMGATAVTPETAAPEPKSIAERAAERHAARTQEQVADIRKRWYTRQLANLQEDYFNKLLPFKTGHTITDIYHKLKAGDLDTVQRKIATMQSAVRRHKARTLDDIRRIQDLADEHTYGKEYVEHIHLVENQLGIKRGKRMTHSEADMLRGNPYFQSKTPYSVNCQSCVVAYELRLLGFDVSAMPNLAVALNRPYELSKATERAWLDPATKKTPVKWRAGTPHLSKTGKVMSAREPQLTKELHKLTQDPGRYHINWGWKQNKRRGHIVVFERFKDGTFRIYDPQTSGVYAWEDLVKKINLRYGVDVLRVDNKLFDPLWKDVVTPRAKEAETAKKTLGKKYKPAKTSGGVNGSEGVPKELFKARKEQSEQLKADKDYKDVFFNPNNCGVKATHRLHNFDKKGGKYELMAQEAGYKNGDSVILGKEQFGEFKQRFTEGTWNGKLFEVAGCETATSNNIMAGITHCGSKQTTQYAVLVFPKGGFNKETLQRSINRFKGLKKCNSKQYHEFERIICVQNEEIVYNEAF